MALKLDDEKLLEYVKNVSELETSCFSQKQAIEKVKEVQNQIESTPPVIEQIDKPVMRTVEPPVRPISPTEPISPPTILSDVGWILLIVLGGGLAITGFVFFWNEFMFHMILALCFFVLGIAAIGGGVTNLSGNKRDRESYEGRLFRYNQDLRVYREELAAYEEEMSSMDRKREQARLEYNDCVVDYNNRVAMAKEKYNDDINNHQLACTDVESSISKMNDLLVNTSTILEKLYDLDVIFPKYRNMVVMSTILEYLESGRCSSLTGPDGAYNLYESELRQNRIIDKLDTVISQLEQVKENQFILYTEIKKANETVSYIALKASQITDSTKRIEANTAMAAYCAEITATYTTALAYLEAFR